PWLALEGAPKTVEPLLAVPQVLARDSKGWSRSWPETELPGWDYSKKLLPLWRSGRPDAKHPGGFLTPAGVGKFLAGGLPDDDDWLEQEDLCGFENRTGIAVQGDTLTAAEGAIYGIRLLVLKPRVDRAGPHKGKKVRLYAEALLPEAAPADEAVFDQALPLGG